jgi:hypothetical protein
MDDAIAAGTNFAAGFQEWISPFDMLKNAR